MSARLLLAAVRLKPVSAGDRAGTACARDGGCDAFAVAQSGSRRFMDCAAAAGPPVLSPAGRALLIALLATPSLMADPATAQSSGSPDGARPTGAPAVLPSVEVTGACAHARDVDCANRALQAAARQAQNRTQNRARSIAEVPAPGADSPGPAVGVSGQAGASLRLGPALGSSVQRPAPPRTPSAPRPGGPS